MESETRRFGLSAINLAADTSVPWFLEGADVLESSGNVASGCGGRRGIADLLGGQFRAPSRWNPDRSAGQSRPAGAASGHAWQLDRARRDQPLAVPEGEERARFAAVDPSA